MKGFRNNLLGAGNTWSLQLVNGGSRIILHVG